MPEEKKQEEPLTVVDRRRFTEEGERRSGVETSKVPEPPLAPPPPPSAAPAAESDASRAARQAYERQGGPRQYKVDFETLVMSLSTSAMYQLGLVEDPVRGRPPADLEGAQHTIDMLGVIQEKARGNLTPQEKRLLEQVLYELRISYVALAGGKSAQGGSAPGGKPGAPSVRGGPAPGGKAGA